MFVDTESATRSYQQYELITKDSDHQPLKFTVDGESKQRNWFDSTLKEADSAENVRAREAAGEPGKFGVGEPYWYQRRIVENGEWQRGVRYYSVTTLALHMALIIGSITFWGSLVACGKLMGKPKFLKKNFIPPARVFTHHILCLGGSVLCCFIASEGREVSGYS